MNRSEFLSSLKDELRRIPQVDRNEILYDYEEHFSIGLEQGKTEEEISMDLGDPRTIARQFNADIIENQDIDSKSFGNYLQNDSTYGHHVDETLSFSGDGITEIKIDCGSPNVRVSSIEGDEILAHLYGNTNSGSEDRYPRVYARRDNNRLVLKVNQPETFGISRSLENQELHLDVSIPKTYTADISVYTSSGNASIEGFSLNRLTGIASSGSLYVRSITAKECKFEASSGKIELNDLNSQDSEVNTSSGNITVNTITGNLKAVASSGTIFVAYNRFQSDIDVTTSSGKVEINLPESSEFLLSARASSGSIRNDFPLTDKGEDKHNSLKGIVGKGLNTINVRTSSGNINIVKR